MSWINKMKYKKINDLQKDLEFFNRQKLEIVELIETIKSLKKELNFLSPIGGGIYIDTKLNNETFKLNIGSGKIVEKTKEELIELLTKRISDIEIIEKEKNIELLNLQNK